MVSKAAFDDAYANAGKLKGGSDNDKLALYAFAKIAKADDISKAAKPGTFDFAGKAKRAEWQKQVDAGTTKDQAMQKYVEKFNEMKTKHGVTG